MRAIDFEGSNAKIAGTTPALVNQQLLLVGNYHQKKL